MFQIDKVLKSHRHTAIRLPPYHAELNAIELIWSNLKGYVGHRNLKFKKAKVEELTQEGIDYWREGMFGLLQTCDGCRAGIVEERYSCGGRG